MGALQSAAKSGNRLKALTELRDILAIRLETAESDRDVASLSRQFVLVTKEIEEIRSSAVKTTSISEMREKLRVAK